MVVVILTCEIGFWVFLALGLITRYLLRWERASWALLAMSPLLDLVLLGATAASIHRGEVASVGHALAAIYIGFSVAYGRKLIGWADAQFAYRFARGPKPVSKTGQAYTKECWADVLRTGTAVIIACGLSFLLQRYAASRPFPTANESAQIFASNYRWMAAIFAIDTLWAMSYTIWPRRKKETSAHPAT
ncbi:hypothetical protein [Corynebacterium heidelbergense]|uniref:Uncharacterized protein n=1 Tax=Corynebacterium heidelbergense TaxID=2055947 RepID=A0A364V497_9CORY|nr:hypothetical protein [Corynebacterium heidelbergense]RAV31449.1 hypothetical protein DLJ54_08290 [Corynebacterium heidelbergense]